MKRIVIGTVAFCALAAAQNPVFQPAVNIDQDLLLSGKIPLRKVLQSGGQFYTTPYQPYDATTQTGDGYGEGVNGPRAAQRHAFNKLNPTYPLLRMNGLDSQSCYECHNSIGSSAQFAGIQDDSGALIRKPFPVGGSAGSNSNAFINPMFPDMLTLFIRNPPHVFGSGYTQTLAGEMTQQLFLLRVTARTKAKATPGVAVAQALTANGLSFGTFTTTFTPGTTIVKANPNCAAGAKTPLFIGGATDFTDDVTGVTGVNCDLVVRPLQWKGVASSIRHFVRDALDFHLSMQAFEKVGLCDCDLDGKGTPGTGPEVTIGNVTALASFVAMTRPPVQMTDPGKQPVVALGRSIFTGTATGLTLPNGMCTQCHTAMQTIHADQFVHIEGPTQNSPTAGNNENQLIDPKDPSTWAVTPAMCPGGTPTASTGCPVETSYGSPANKGALVTPVLKSTNLAVVRRFNQALARTGAANAVLSTNQFLRQSALIVEPGEYRIPLTPDPATVTPYQLNRLPVNKDGSIDVPLFSDLRTHNMGACLSDPTMGPHGALDGQGTDVAGINTMPTYFLTRPLWGVADTGPWLHDARALTLRQAILQHGDTSNCSGSEANAVIDAFEKLTGDQQQAVVEFLLTLRLPVPAGTLPASVAKK